MIRLAIFDCDGTLVDSAAPIFDALAQTLGEHGFGVPPKAQCRRVIGLSLVEAMAALVPAAAAVDHVRLADAYKLNFARLRSAGLVDEPLFDGVLEVLDALDSDGWLLAVATGKSDRGLRHCLDQHGIHARFVSLQTADRHPSKPHPAMALQAIADAGATPEMTVVIGDTSFDMAMARSAGARAIGAGWGYHQAHELLDSGAAAVAAEPRDLLPLLKVAA